MKVLLVIIGFVASTSLVANEKIVLKTEKLSNGDQKHSIDLNQDGKADTFQVFRKGVMLSQERDTEFNGKINEWYQYSDYVNPKTAVLVKKIDTNADGKVDRIESVYRDPGKKKLITTFQIDSTGNGKFDRTWTNVSELNQKDQSGLCAGTAVSEEELIKNLYKNVSKASSKLNDGFIVNEQGYKIHQSCLENWGADEFPSMFKNSMEQGFQCLRKLANDNVKNNPSSPNGAKKNMVGLLALLQTSGISIVCGEKGYDWNGTAGHASAYPAEKMSDPKVNHPYVSINPNYPKTKREATKEEKDELMKTMFHEQLHNLGIVHNESHIEYPYTCETCCLPSKEDKPEDVAISCKICAGTYTSNKDQAYLKDFIEWGQKTYNAGRAQKAVVAYQMEKPKDRFGIFAFADISSGTFQPIGIEVAKMLKKKFPERTQEEEAILEKSLDNEYFDHNKRAAPFAKLAAEAHMSLYYDHDENKALTFLENNKKALRELTNRSKSASQNDKYVVDNVYEHLDDLIGKIWMKGYPDNRGPNSDRAYNLLKSTGFLK